MINPEQASGHSGFEYAIKNSGLRECENRECEDIGRRYGRAKKHTETIDRGGLGEHEDRVGWAVMLERYQWINKNKTRY